MGILEPCRPLRYLLLAPAAPSHSEDSNSTRHSAPSQSISYCLSLNAILPEGKAIKLPFSYRLVRVCVPNVSAEY